MIKRRQLRKVRGNLYFHADLPRGRQDFRLPHDGVKTIVYGLLQRCDFNILSSAKEENEPAHEQAPGDIGWAVKMAPFVEAWGVVIGACWANVDYDLSVDRGLLFDDVAAYADEVLMELQEAGYTQEDLATLFWVCFGKFMESSVSPKEVAATADFLPQPTADLHSSPSITASPIAAETQAVSGI